MLVPQGGTVQRKETDNDEVVPLYYFGKVTALFGPLDFSAFVDRVEAILQVPAAPWPAASRLPSTPRAGPLVLRGG